MKFTNIKRNSLDFILSDLLPVELPELYTNKYFYEYLIGKNKCIKDMINLLIVNKNNIEASKKLFEASGWTSMPLKYTIAKNFDADREMNVLQPTATLELFLFITLFEKEILNYMDKNSICSLRYHRKNSDLFYKQRKKTLTKYFADISKKVNRAVLQQTGLYFDIGPFQSINAFTSSDLWFELNRKYRYFARTDYKACFDSIYTHTYKWLIGKDVNDTKGFKNVNIFTTIDRILQNINASTSNGVVIGPEFSRMIAEILLQGIDSTVVNSLYIEGFKHGNNYVVYRFVDDIFIFAESEYLIDLVLKQYEKVARSYLLSLNDRKLVKEKIPFVLEEWLKETNEYATQTGNILFYTDNEQNQYVNEKKTELAAETDEQQVGLEEAVEPHLFRSRLFNSMRAPLMSKFNGLICAYPQKTKTIVSYNFGMITNRIVRSRNKSRIFSEGIAGNTLFKFLDYIMYIYSFYPDFVNTQKLLSIISYINDEVDFKNYEDVLSRLINKYSFIFDKANMNDIVNLILFCTEWKLEIPYRQESGLEEKMAKEDNPLLYASYLIYSRYNVEYFNKILGVIEGKIVNKMESIIEKKNILTYREFWWLLIFNKCPYLSSSVQDVFNQIIDNNFLISYPTTNKPVDICNYLLGDFLANNKEQFFEWNLDNKNLLREMTYKTYERSIFKNYRPNYSFMELNSFE